MRGRGILPVVLLVLIMSFWIGCAGPMQESTSDADTQSADQQASGADVELSEQVYVDVYATGDNDWRDRWQPDIKPPARFDLSAGDDETEAAADQDLRMVQGFRIQLADVLEHASASEIQDRALEWFDYVYVTFRSPNYKVRAGNCKSRVDAEQKLQLAREHGFRDAWIVPDWVFENPPPSMRIVADSLAADSLATGLEGVSPDVITGD